jgi:hypothetical protein
LIPDREDPGLEAMYSSLRDDDFRIPVRTDKVPSMDLSECNLADVGRQ